MDIKKKYIKPLLLVVTLDSYSDSYICLSYDEKIEYTETGADEGLGVLVNEERHSLWDMEW